jgi:ParB-like chromosome segregation protein Spo0J
MEFHPASNLFPLLEGEDFEKLKSDIQKNGCLEPVIILDEMILDGRNRWRACQELGIRPPIKEFSTDTPIKFILSMNLHRRHLTPSQKAHVGAEALPEFEAEAKKRQVESPSGKGKRLDSAKLPEPIKGKATEKVAALVGVSPRYVQEAKAIKEQRPDLAEKIKAKEMTIPQAKREMDPRPQKDKDEESDPLWNLKRWWKRATKKDRKTFLEWVEKN